MPCVSANRLPLRLRSNMAANVMILRLNVNLTSVDFFNWFSRLGSDPFSGLKIAGAEKRAVYLHDTEIKERIFDLNASLITS